MLTTYDFLFASYSLHRNIIKKGFFFEVIKQTLIVCMFTATVRYILFLKSFKVNEIALLYAVYSLLAIIHCCSDAFKVEIETEKWTFFELSYFVRKHKFFKIITYCKSIVHQHAKKMTNNWNIKITMNLFM